MSEQQALLLIMTKMALADGEIGAEEQAFLAEHLPAGQSLESLQAEAQQHGLAELTAQVQVYADRFFVALRAACMAHIDLQLDPQEAALYSDLLAQLALEPADQQLIQDYIDAMYAGTEPPVTERFESLYQQSAFHQAV